MKAACRRLASTVYFQKGESFMLFSPLALRLNLFKIEIIAADFGFRRGNFQVDFRGGVGFYRLCD